MFIVEDSNEIILNGWNGDGKTDTGNIIYTVTRPEIRGGPPPVTMYDLIRSALRSRPHGVVIGEARGAEAWELIRAAATGHGHSAFTIHATSAEHVWPRFLQVSSPPHYSAGGLCNSVGIGLHFGLGLDGERELHEYLIILALDVAMGTYYFGVELSHEGFKNLIEGFVLMFGEIII